MTDFKYRQAWATCLVLIGLSGCGSEPADLQQWQQALNARPPTPLPAWPNQAHPYALSSDAPTTLALFDPARLRPQNAQEALAFYPLSQLRYVGHIQTPNDLWAIIHTPSGTYLAPTGSLLGLAQAWQIDQITPAALTLTTSTSTAEPRLLPLSTPSATPPS